VKRLARSRTLATALVGLAPLLIRLLLLPWMPVPAPRIHDEFSHLLLADTLAHGRLVNPVHPMWPHFDSMHMLVRPVYASIYPPAHGAIMAVGLAVAKYSWAGVWLSVGLMCAAVCWMLQGWVSPGWALLGSALVAGRLGVTSYWMNSYYGGAMAAVGGALVLGALPRLCKRQRWRDAALLALGFVLLANTRPYEGLVFSLPVVAALLWRLRGRLLSRAVAIPLVVVLGASALGMGYYYAAFTGNPLLMPYYFFRKNFTEAPHFILQSPRPERVYLHREVRTYYAIWEMASYHDARANRAPHGLMDKAKGYTRFYVGPVLAIPFLLALLRWRRPRVRFLLLTVAAISAAVAVEVWHSPHYAAPALGATTLLIVEGLRQARQLPWGSWFVAAICAASLATPVMHGGARVGDGRARQAIVDRLLADGGNHLILTRYAFRHNPGDEWVYNGADIDASPVVWAREMDPLSNRRLLDYFAGRRVWLAQPDTTPPELTPYDSAPPPEQPFAFVPFGTEGVEAMRSAAAVRQKILDRLKGDLSLRSCDRWNWEFTTVTGILPADPTRGCFPPGDRERDIDFERWWEWFVAQR
jgi:hypothetical protein